MRGSRIEGGTAIIKTIDAMTEEVDEEDAMWMKSTDGREVQMQGGCSRFLTLM